MNCPKCSSADIIDGTLSGGYGVNFIKKGTEKKLKPEAYKVECKACKNCGNLFDFQIQLNQKKD